MFTYSLCISWLPCTWTWTQQWKKNCIAGCAADIWKHWFILTLKFGQMRGCISVFNLRRNHSSVWLCGLNMVILIVHAFTKFVNSVGGMSVAIIVFIWLMFNWEPHSEILRWSTFADLKLICLVTSYEHEVCVSFLGKNWCFITLTIWLSVTIQYDNT